METKIHHPPRLQDIPDRVILYDVSWRTYQCLLDNYVDCQTPRLAYDRGTLEILVTLSMQHEVTNRAQVSIVDLAAEEWGIETRYIGSATLTREDRQIGLEPDTSFYIANEPKVRARRELDLTVDPPPDLVLDVECTDYWLDRMPIFAGFGVPEVWRYDGNRVTIYALAGGVYRPDAMSSALPPLSDELLTRFVDESRTVSSLAWRPAVRDWARQQDAPDRPTL